ncbi:MAG: sulfatase family protein [Planctomycetota bacterium]
MTAETYTRREFLKAVGMAAAALAVPGCGRSARVVGSASAEKPNFIIILTDDQGYNDLGSFGSKLIRTPNIDRMAAEGVRLTSFYTGGPLCAPSRAAIMTGCYPQRVAQLPGPEDYFMADCGDYHTVLDGSEITIAEVLRKVGYTTMAIGKWHLSGSGYQAVSKDRSKEALARFEMRHRELMPLQQGFDSYFGIPYSNDMNPSVLMRDNSFVEAPVKQQGLTTRYTDEAMRFIEHNRNRPFLLYLAHNMPHTPLHPSEKFEGNSPYGLYGDCVEEIDWNTGRILQTLRKLGIDENTLVVFTSDNGPWNEGGQRTPDNRASRLQSGTADPLRGYKMTTWEGGPRVPCVMRWPGRLPAGRVSDEITTTMDLMPTLARLAGTTEPKDRIIDGKDLMSLLTGRTDKSPHEAYYFYKHTILYAVRSGHWKLVLPRPRRPKNIGWYGRLQEEVRELTLYNLRDDIGETTNVASQHPDIVARLQSLLERARKDLGDANQPGRGRRKRPQNATSRQR